MRRRDVPNACRLALSDVRLQDRLLRMVMDVIQSRIRTDTSEYRSNRDAMKQLVEGLNDRLAAPVMRVIIKRRRHREQSKLSVRERVDRLIDPAAPFLELSPLAARGMYDDTALSLALGAAYRAPIPGPSFRIFRM